MPSRRIAALPKRRMLSSEAQGTPDGQSTDTPNIKTESDDDSMIVENPPPRPNTPARPEHAADLRSRAEHDPESNVKPQSRFKSDNSSVRGWSAVGIPTTRPWPHAKPVALFIGLLDPSVPFCIRRIVQSGLFAFVMAADVSGLHGQLRDLCGEDLVSKFVRLEECDITDWNAIRKRLDPRDWSHFYVKTIIFATIAGHEYRKPLNADDKPEDAECRRHVISSMIEYCYDDQIRRPTDIEDGPVICITALAPHFLGDLFVDHHTLDYWMSREHQLWRVRKDDISKAKWPPITVIIARPLYGPDGSTFPGDPLLYPESERRNPWVHIWFRPEDVGTWICNWVVQENFEDFCDFLYRDQGRFVRLIPSWEMEEMRVACLPRIHPEPGWK